MKSNTMERWRGSSKIPILEVSIPEYTVETAPDSKAIGEKIDQVLISHFRDKRLVVRCLSSKDHPGKSLDDLVALISQIGIDRYDDEQKGDRYNNVEGKKIDFFALERIVRPGTALMEQFINSMYFDARRFGFEPTRIDIVLLYSWALVQQVVHTYADARQKDDGYVFKDPERKTEALAGIVKVL